MVPAWLRRISRSAGWLRLGLVLFAVALATVAWATPASDGVGGAWRSASTYAGTASSAEPAAHDFVVGVPPTLEDGGVRVDGGAATVSFRDASPTASGTSYRVLVTDRAGAMLYLDHAIDPTNPMSAPHGPPSVILGPGEYTLVVSPLDDRAVDYRIELATTFSVHVDRTGILVQPQTLLLLAAVGFLIALVPLPRAWVEDPAFHASHPPEARAP